MNSSTVTQENKEYVNVFIDGNSTCYKVDANIGDIYEPAVTHQECYKAPNLVAPMVMTFIPGVNIIAWIWYGVQNSKVNRGKAKVVPCD